VGLSELNFASETISTPGGDFVVRGLSFLDVMDLVEAHGPALAGAFTRISESQETSLEVVVGMAGKLAKGMPDLAAAVIAAGAGEPGAIDVAVRLPFPIQVEALEKIGRLTFQTEADVKNLVETAIRMMQGAAGTIQSLRQP
jgi:hypothetical protein